MFLHVVLTPINHSAQAMRWRGTRLWEHDDSRPEEVWAVFFPKKVKVYIYLSVYVEMKQRFKVSGALAQAYVVAHEVGHHLQKMLGIMDQVEAARQNMGETQANNLQVRVELQADCFA